MSGDGGVLQSDYVVVFRGARDHYEAAAALAEAGRLSTLVTDFYAPDRLMALMDQSSRGRQLLGRRHSLRLPSRLVTTMLSETLPLKTEGRRRPSAVADRMGASAARRLGRDGALVYSYHWPGFRGVCPTRTAGQGPQVLFQVHPPAHQVRSELTRDRERSGIDAGLEEEELLSDEDVNRESMRLATADGAIVASRFVARGLIQIGVPADTIATAPYGSSWPADQVARRQHSELAPHDLARPLRLVWVGQLAYRKAPHWLLRAIAALPKSAVELTIVTRSAVPQWLLPLPDNVRVRNNVSRAELPLLLERQDLFVMPSLVEGFGLVYLESMAAGTPVMATQNTGVPDFTDQATRLLVEPGDWEDIAEQLMGLIDTPGLLRHMQAGVARAELPSWQTFRAQVRRGLASAESRIDVN